LSPTDQRCGQGKQSDVAGFGFLEADQQFQRRRGLALPAYLSDEGELHRQLAAGGALDDCKRLDSAEPGCFVLLRSFDEGERHIGVMVDGYKMLHAHRGIGAVLDVLSRSVWARRVIGFYRAEVAA